jgi:H+/Cl- antiporter ClcA/CBS domain-containing protein
MEAYEAVKTPEDRGSTTEGVGVSPSLGPVLEYEQMTAHATLFGRDVWRLAGLSVMIGAVAAVVAMALLRLIGLLTNLCFYGRFSLSFADPTSAHLGIWVIAVPIIGAVVVGIMARYGHAGIRGHGIPEAMENILTNQSRIPMSLTLLKPISAAISIGTGGPFGAEGPIIATGGAFGSLVGQILHTTADERKILLSAGAAAGMAATFGSPVSAVLLAVELLLFEFRARSLVPVALASATAAGLRIIFMGDKPIFAMPNVGPANHWSLIFYAVIGLIAGVAAAGVTRLLYLVEDGFEKYSHVHWMWWPALGAVVVGVCGYFDHHSMGVGYDNIFHLLAGGMAIKAILMLLILKWISWTVALGSGTSGGTLAPLFTLGSALGLLLGMAVVHFFPDSGVDVRVAALVGMAALFAGASRALLTSIVFAFETTMQPHGLLPLLAGCTTAFLVSCLLMRDTIMTEKIARRGIRVQTEYSTDFLDRLFVRDAYTREAICLDGSRTVAETRQLIFAKWAVLKHHEFPILNDDKKLVGVLSYRELLDTRVDPAIALRSLINRKPIVIEPDSPLRLADNLMSRYNVGHLIVTAPDKPDQVIGVITRTDLLAAHRRFS